jgi:hypothetical protein
MLLIIIGFVIGIFIATYDFRYSIFDYDFFRMLLVSSTGGFVGLVIAFSIPAKSTMVLEHEYDVVSMNFTNNQIGGDFFLGSGTINNIPKYMFYCKDSNGFIQLEQIDCERSKIKYGPKPYVKKYESESTNDFINWFAIDEIVTEYVIQVPEGSITPLIDINLHK